MIFSKKKKTEDAIIEKMIEAVKEEIDELEKLLEFLKKNQEKGISESFEKCKSEYKRRLNYYKENLKKQYDDEIKILEEKHKKLKEKPPKIKPFSFTEKEEKLIRRIETLISFSDWFPKFYRDHFKAVFNSPKHFFKFFFLEYKYDLRKPRDYRILKSSLKHILDFNKNLPDNWNLGSVEETLPKLIGDVMVAFHKLDGKIEDFKEKVKEPVKEIERRQKELKKSK